MDNLTRTGFLAGVGSLAVAGCSGNSGLYVPSRKALSLTELLKMHDLVSVTQHGVRYFADGSTKTVTRKPLLNCAPGEISCAPDVGIAPMTLQIIGRTAGYYNTYNYLTNWQGGPFTPNGPNIPASAGPIFSFATALPSCGPAVFLAVGAALAAVQYILANAPNYSAMLVQTAQAALDSWGPTGLGTAAAFEFLGGIVAAILGLDALTILGILAGAATTIGLLWAAWACFTGQ